MLHRFALWAGFAWSAAELAGCGGGPTFIVQQYAGSPRPRETIAIVRVNYGGPELFSIDAERLRAAPQSGTRLHVEMLPGVHEVGVIAPNLGMTHGIMLRFVADAGKVYRIIVRTALSNGAPGSGFKAYAYEVDRDSDAELEEARLPPEAPAPLPPSRGETAIPARDAGASDAGPSAEGAAP